MKLCVLSALCAFYSPMALAQQTIHPWATSRMSSTGLTPIRGSFPGDDRIVDLENAPDRAEAEAAVSEGASTQRSDQVEFSSIWKLG
ncbi:MAG: hypothetical protein PW789_03200 [Edaphobacter sp.]|uniref:hypothetical protein n=1 Tax=Edaphobacter sp. TaxID=1934404 RepID=UPI002382F636|nr:hypothetical protein [Edaphobacter sp.]MDE1175592.1 hypothetical protein [Edaphobacter sp.]